MTETPGIITELILIHSETVSAPFAHSLTRTLTDRVTQRTSAAASYLVESLKSTPTGGMILNGHRQGIKLPHQGRIEFEFAIASDLSATFTEVLSFTEDTGEIIRSEPNITPLVCRERSSMAAQR